MGRTLKQSNKSALIPHRKGKANAKCVGTGTGSSENRLSVANDGGKTYSVIISNKSKSKYAGRQGVKLPAGHTLKKFNVLLDGDSKPVLISKKLVRRNVSKWDYTADVENLFEDAPDDDSPPIDENFQPPAYICPSCGYSNLGTARVCGNCNQERVFTGWGGCFGHLKPTWTCQECTQPNDVALNQCNTCNTPRNP